MIKNIFSLFFVTFLISACSTPKITEKQTITVHVQGEVSNPGKYELEKLSGSVNALVLAGGFTIYAKPVYHITLSTAGRGKFYRRDIYKILSGDEDDIVSGDGNIIIVWSESWGGRHVYKPDEVLNQMKEYIQE